MLSIGLGSQPTTECGIFGSHQCLELDGNSDFVNLHGTILSAINPNAGTISCWVNLRDNDGGTTQSMVRLADDDTNNGMTLQFHRANTEFRAVYRLDGTYKEATYNDASFSLSDYFDQGWVHLAMTWTSNGEGVGEVKMYFNGQNSETVAQTSNWGSDEIDVARIGAHDDGASGFTDGFIDQVAIFNRTKDAYSIAAIYNEGVMRDLTTFHGRYYNTTGLLAYYQFEGNALDSSGNGYHGTLIEEAGFNTTQP